MIRGIDSFREWFSGCEEQYAIIGGAACDLLMTEEGLGFRATKDIDLVLIIEAVDKEFGRRFWEYVEAAKYEHMCRSTGTPQFYRFTNPQSRDYPIMIELFTRRTDVIALPENAVLTPLPIDDEVFSLSAILLDDDYYAFLKHGRVQVSGITVLDAPYLIPFKAKAWLDLSARKAAGEPVDSKNIRKHKNDVFRLTEVLNHAQNPIQDIPITIRDDMGVFIERMKSEEVDLKQLKILEKTKDSVLGEIAHIYGISK